MKEEHPTDRPMLFSDQVRKVSTHRSKRGLSVGFFCGVAICAALLLIDSRMLLIFWFLLFVLAATTVAGGMIGAYMDWRVDHSFEANADREDLLD